MTTCRSCDAQVIFVPSATTGKSMILDAKPHKGVVLTVAGAGTIATSEYPRDVHEARVVDVYTDHHVTCPDAASYRKPKAAAR